MTACQQYRSEHGPAETWAPGEIDGYLAAMDEDRASGAAKDARTRKEGKGDDRHR
jgi:hypothetical protein